MGQINTPRPVLLIVAVVSRYESAISWFRQRAETQWGEAALSSEPFSFDNTDYYEKTMGSELKKAFMTFEELIDPADIAEIKCLTNRWEEEYASQSDHEEPRPLNLDPGYLTLAKLVLATTKDRDHRIYLNHGIYAETTLYYYHGNWTGREWTYPDYMRDDFHVFFARCRDYLRERYRAS